MLGTRQSNRQTLIQLIVHLRKSIPKPAIPNPIYIFLAAAELNALKFRRITPRNMPVLPARPALDPVIEVNNREIRNARPAYCNPVPVALFTTTQHISQSLSHGHLGTAGSGQRAAGSGQKYRKQIHTQRTSSRRPGQGHERLNITGETPRWTVGIRISITATSALARAPQ